jgi:hypothetical protein
MTVDEIVVGGVYENGYTGQGRRERKAEAVNISFVAWRSKTGKVGSSTRDDFARWAAKRVDPEFSQGRQCETGGEPCVPKR